MRSLKSSCPLAILVLLQAAGSSSIYAQESLLSVSRVAVAPYGVPPLEPFTDDREVLQLYVGGQTQRHSNLFALPDGVSPESKYGGSARGDTVFQGLLGVSFDRQLGLQRYRLDAAVLPVKYAEYSKYDYVGYSTGAHWDWAIGRPWFGTLGMRLTSGETPFGNYYEDARNIQKRAQIYGSAGVRLTPSWGLFIGLDTQTLDNSYSGVQSADYRLFNTETGLRYAPGTGTEVDLVWRYTDGEYPNRQVTDEFGNLLPSTVDNAFKQDALLARMQIRPSDAIRVSGTLGFVNRAYDNLSERDYSGPTATLTVDLRPTGAFSMRADLIRDIQSEELLTASYAELTSLRLTPRILLTGRTSLFARFVVSNIVYDGDPGYTSSGAAVREDRLTVLGFGISYELSRTITTNLFARRTERDSNYNSYDYIDDVISVNVIGRF